MGNVILNDWQDAQPAKAAARPARGAGRRFVPQFIAARYDAAVIDDDNRKHWANADALSARQANSIDVRYRLRNHSRYEVANNCYAGGIGRTLADAVVGYGPTLNFRRSPETTPEQMQALRETGRLFGLWAAEVDLWEKVRLMRFTRYQDGEAFAVFRNNPRLRSTPIELDLQLVEAEQVTDGYRNMDTLDPKRVDGIETDAMGNPILYHVLTDHPGDGWPTDGTVLDIPADQMIHWYRADRPGQLRGIPETTPALPLFSQLRRFTLATLNAAEQAANVAGIIKTETSPDEDDEQIEPFEAIEWYRNMLMTLPGGTDIEQFKAEHPTTTYAEFKTEILCEVGRALQLPRMLVLLDASKYNYASGRLDRQAFDRFLEIEQFHCALHVLNKIFEAWFTEALLIPGFLPAAVENGMLLEPEWMWPALGHVDRKKEADGQTAELANHTTNLAIEWAKQGFDWEQQLRQRAKELQLLRELGLSVASQPQQGAGENGDDDPSGEGQDDEGGEDSEDGEPQGNASNSPAATAGSAR